MTYLRRVALVQGDIPPHGHEQADVTSLVPTLAGKAPVSHLHAAADVTSGLLASPRLGTGSAGSAAYLRGDQVWTPFPVTPLSAVRLATDRTTSVTANLVDVVGLSFALVAGALYAFAFAVLFQVSGVLVGMGLAVNGPAATAVAYRVEVPNSASGSTLRHAGAPDEAAVTTGLDLANTTRLATIQGLIAPSADGTLVVRYRANGLLPTVTILAGSTGHLYAVA